jgi:hypothetical protein
MPRIVPIHGLSALIPLAFRRFRGPSESGGLADAGFQFVGLKVQFIDRGADAHVDVGRACSETFGSTGLDVRGRNQLVSLSAGFSTCFRYSGYIENGRDDIHESKKCNEASQNNVGLLVKRSTFPKFHFALLPIATLIVWLALMFTILNFAYRLGTSRQNAASIFVVGIGVVSYLHRFDGDSSTELTHETRIRRRLKSSGDI